ncbi:amidohydrolase family protein, partial [Xylella fastidiosa]|uniref:amidohydrolase family protein n=1 Tax=Xylella fastidiosa TaxID=2371 RepID=UPI001930F72F
IVGIILEVAARVDHAGDAQRIDVALLNAAALRVVGYGKDTPNPPGGEIVRDAAGNPTGLLLAQPNATILYSTLAKGPKLPQDYQLNST